MALAAKRLRVKWMSRRPCEKTRSTAVDVAEDGVSHPNQKAKLTKYTWNAEIVHSHQSESRISLTVIPPPEEGVFNLLGRQLKEFVKFIGFLDVDAL